jgi:DNA end-binding protein Ku
MAATIWSGTLSFGLVTIPVRMVTATRSHNISFHLLHETCKTRIKLHNYCSFHKKVVERSELVKGFEYRKNEYVIITQEELDRAETESSKVLDIAQFVELSDVDPIYYEKTYALEPPDEKSGKPYYLLLEAMKEKRRAAVGLLLMRDREYLALIRPYGDLLVLHLLLFEDEIVIKKKRSSTKSQVKEKETGLALQLVEQLTEKFNPGQFKNTYIERVQQLIEAKIRNKKVRFYQPKPRKQIGDLMEALQKSVKLAASKNGKPGKLRVVENPPIRNYDRLKVDEIKKKITSLSSEEVQQLADYEQRHKKRKSVLSALMRSA